MLHCVCFHCKLGYPPETRVFEYKKSICLPYFLKRLLGFLSQWLTRKNIFQWKEPRSTFPINISIKYWSIPIGWLNNQWESDSFQVIYIHSILIESDILFVKLFALHLGHLCEGPPVGGSCWTINNGTIKLSTFSPDLDVVVVIMESGSVSIIRLGSYPPIIITTVLLECWWSLWVIMWSITNIEKWCILISSSRQDMVSCNARLENVDFVISNWWVCHRTVPSSYTLEIFNYPVFNGQFSSKMYIFLCFCKI